MTDDAAELRVGRRSVRLPNPDKVMFPEVGTESDLVSCHREVVEQVLSHPSRFAFPLRIQSRRPGV